MQEKQQKLVCEECGAKKIRKDVYKAHGVAVCTDCARELNLLCECGRPMYVMVAIEGPTCKRCLLAMAPGMMTDTSLESFNPNREYEVVSIYAAFGCKHLVVPPGQPEELTKELIERLREAYRITDGLVEAKVVREKWKGLELLEEWAKASSADSYPASFGAFNKATVEDLVG